MQALDLSNLFTTTDPNTTTDSLITLLTNTISKNTTIKILPKRKAILKPWITPGLLRCLRNRYQMHRKTKASPNNEVLKITCPISKLL